MLRRPIALVTIAALATTGCAGRAWPKQTTNLADPAFVERGALTVDVLPLDLALWVEDGAEVDPAVLRARTEEHVLKQALDALARGAFSTNALIDWNGQAAGAEVLQPQALLATTSALAGYGAMVEQQPGELPAPGLPQKLGEATGADATLYVGGWAYVPKHRQSTGDKVLEGVALALVAMAAIMIVAMITKGGSSKSTSSSKSKSKSKSTSSSSGSRIRDHRTNAPAAASAPGPFVGVPVIRDHRTATSIRDHRSGGSSSPSRGGRHVSVDLSWLDPINTSVEGDPTWRSQEPPDSLGDKSTLYLEMTLVDNRTGLALWHAHQAFPANIAKAGDIDRAARLLLASLPTGANVH